MKIKINPREKYLEYSKTELVTQSGVILRALQKNSNIAPADCEKKTWQTQLCVWIAFMCVCVCGSQFDLL